MADWGGHVGIVTGPMVVVHPSTDPWNYDAAFYGPLYGRARMLAEKATHMDVGIVADAACEIPLPGLAWERSTEEDMEGLVVGRIDLSRQHTPGSVGSEHATGSHASSSHASGSSTLHVPREK